MQIIKKAGFAISLFLLSVVLLNCGGNKEYEVYYWTNIIKERGLRDHIKVFLDSTREGTHQGKLVMTMNKGTKREVTYTIPFEYSVKESGDKKTIKANYTSTMEKTSDIPGRHDTYWGAMFTWQVAFNGEFVRSDKKSEFYNSYNSSGIGDRGELILINQLGATLRTYNGKKRVSQSPYYMYSSLGAKLALVAK